MKVKRPRNNAWWGRTRSKNTGACLGDERWNCTQLVGTYGYGLAAAVMFFKGAQGGKNIEVHSPWNQLMEITFMRVGKAIGVISCSTYVYSFLRGNIKMEGPLYPAWTTRQIAGGA